MRCAFSFNLCISPSAWGPENFLKKYAKKIMGTILNSPYDQIKNFILYLENRSEEDELIVLDKILSSSIVNFI